MLVTMNNTQIESTEREIYEFLFHQVNLGIPFEQIESFFLSEDLTRIKELWIKAETEWMKIKDEWNRAGYMYNQVDLREE